MSSDRLDLFDFNKYDDLIGPNKAYYLNQFQSFKEKDGWFLPSINIPALLCSLSGFGWVWFAYRKMYVLSAMYYVFLSVVILLTGMAASTFGLGDYQILIGLVLNGLFFGLYANAFYYKSLYKLVLSLQKKGYTEEEHKAVLEEKGGVSLFIGITGGIALIAVIGMIVANKI